eukprot:5595990-Pleurochrysis_carterae.AAC.2
MRRGRIGANDKTERGEPQSGLHQCSARTACLFQSVSTRSLIPSRPAAQARTGAAAYIQVEGGWEGTSNRVSDQVLGAVLDDLSGG